MASSPSSSSSEASVMEQVIAELFAKCVHIILESRSPYVSARNYNAGAGAGAFVSSSSSSNSPNFVTRDKSFNSILKDFSSDLENFELWRHSNFEPLVVEVILNRRKADRNASCTSPAGIFVRNLSSGREEFVCPNRNEKIVERWILQFGSQCVSQPKMDSPSQGRKEGSRGACQSSEFQVMYRKAYKRVIVLFRSLYSAVRLLPAYKLFRDLKGSGQIHQFSLSHRISSFAEPFSREEDAEMSQLDFGPLDIFSRKFSLSVAYLKALEYINMEPSSPLSSEFITDYVGSPLADPLKRFPSLPIVGSAPSYAIFSRQNSWYIGDRETPIPCPPPSDTYPDSQALYPSHHCPCDSTEHLASSSSVRYVSSTAHSNTIDEWMPSPPFSSSSSSLSTPTYLDRSLSRSESAPINIFFHRHKELDGGQNQNLSESSCSKSKRQGCASQIDTLGTERNKISAPITFSPGKKLQFKKESLRLMDFQTDLVSETTSSEKNSTGHIIGFKTPLYTPQLQPRSSNRLSFMDEFDDSDFICHFAEDDEAKNSCRLKSNNGKDHTNDNLLPGELMASKRSPDAAVGSLVWMLRNAPPLRFDKSNTVKSMQFYKDKGSSQKIQLENVTSKKELDLLKVGTTWCLDATTPDLCKLRTAADAFKELMTYKDIKESILKRSIPRLRDIEQIAK